MTPPMTPSAEVMPVVDEAAAALLANDAKDDFHRSLQCEFTMWGVGNLARAYLSALQRAEKAEAMEKVLLADVDRLVAAVRAAREGKQL